MAAYCSFCEGECPHGDKPKECSAKGTKFCRKLKEEHATKPKLST